MKNYCLSLKKTQLIAGVDEVGCGALAGPVIAAAVILHPSCHFMDKLVDSKLLTRNKRLFLYKNIIRSALSWSIGYSNVLEINCFNILQARLLAMKRAVINLSMMPDLILIDGNCSPVFHNIAYQCFKKGDLYISIISAASIVAKVTRDRNMNFLDNIYPKYGFNRNKGYPTVFHIKQLKKYGPTFHHRKNFTPVKYIIQNIFDR